MNAGVSQAMALQLGEVLSDGAHVFTNPESTEFKASMSRWTDVNKQTPTAILQPATELDVEKIVPPPIPCPFSLLPTLTRSTGLRSRQSQNPNRHQVRRQQSLVHHLVRRMDHRPLAPLQLLPGHAKPNRNNPTRRALQDHQRRRSRSRFLHPVTRLGESLLRWFPARWRKQSFKWFVRNGR